jgi:hypothetical protein
MASSATSGIAYPINAAAEANYPRLLDRLEQLEAKADSTTFKGLVRKSMVCAALCGRQWDLSTELLQRYSEIIDTHVAEFRESQERMLDIVARQSQSLNDIEIPALRRLAAERGQVYSQIAIDHVGLQERTVKELVDLLQLAAYIIHTTFLEELCDPGDTERSISAVKSFAAFLAGITPLGPFIDGFYRIKEILNGELEKFGAANDEASRLERWNLAAFYWCVSTRYLCENLAHFGEPGKQITVDDAIALVQADLAKLTSK